MVQKTFPGCQILYIANNWIRCAMKSSLSSLTSRFCWAVIFLLVNCQHNKKKLRWVAGVSPETQRKWMDSTCWFEWILHPPPLLLHLPVYNTAHKDGISFITASDKFRKKSYRAIYFTACSSYLQTFWPEQINQVSFVREEPGLNIIWVTSYLFIVSLYPSRSNVGISNQPTN